jgi:D-3-phosphoglycerate dehydrogenase
MRADRCLRSVTCEGSVSRQDKAHPPSKGTSFHAVRNQAGDDTLPDMARKLLIAADVDRMFIDRARADSRFEVTLYPVKSEDDLAAIVEDCEILVTRAYNRVTANVIDRAPNLRLIAQGTSGTDNIDQQRADERGIRVVSLPGENANAVAELVIGHMIAMTRTVPRYVREVVAGTWQRDDCSTRHELRHHRLGIVGLGQVGRRVARLARVFEMPVTAFDPYLSDDDFRQREAVRSPSLDELIAGSDILTLHVPLSAETRGMMSAKHIRSMNRGSYLINAARGEIFDQQAALEALAASHLAGLAIDVYDPEPPQTGFPDDPRLIVTPHIAGCTYEAKASIGAKLWDRVSNAYP